MHKILAKTLFLGKKTIYLPECPSTNSLAMEYTKNGSAPHGTLFITDKQTAGRGQRGSQWQVAPSKNLTFSLVLKPTFIAPSDQFHLHMIVSLGLLDAIHDFAGEAVIKWPNDIYIKRKKLAGILIENSLRSGRIESSVVGIGLNVNQSDFGTLRTATSLYNTVGHTLDRYELLENIVYHIERYYLMAKAKRIDELKVSYLDQLLGYRKSLEFEDNEGIFLGKIVGITPAGKLRIQKDDVEQHYDIKEVKYLME